MRITINNNMKKQIRQIAKEHGFDVCGFTHPILDDATKINYHNWCAAGMAGDMHYMCESERMQRRLQPQLMLNDCCTVICLACFYPVYNTKGGNSKNIQGIVASYAHNNDYHDIIKKRLKKLTRKLDNLYGLADHRVFVDTAPVAEKALAQCAGIGWIGKNSNIIRNDYGSYLLLSEIFTTLDIVPDKPAINHCGTCTTCIDSCPTQAIIAPYIIDSRLCISYLTIEYRGIIPRNLRAAIGNHIFGCDDCQTVCPWNKFHVSHDNIFVNDGNISNISLNIEEIILLSEASFRQRFRKSAIWRATRAGLVRNALVVAANSHLCTFLDTVRICIKDDNEIVRAHAVWALEQLAGLACIDELHCLLEHENNTSVRQEIVASLHALGIINNSTVGYKG
ncbi:MAG: tRNA epoxyqueuosine(34) reductase QueG [Mariprofundales bacterium]